MFNRIICLIRGHDWEFAYNYGIPLGCSPELYEELKSKSLPVNRCTRCGAYDHESDGLNPYVGSGFSE